MTKPLTPPPHPPPIEPLSPKGDQHKNLSLQYQCRVKESGHEN